MSAAAFIAAVQREAAKAWVVVVYEGCGGVDHFFDPETVLDTAAAFYARAGVVGIRIKGRGGWSFFKDEQPAGLT